MQISLPPNLGCYHDGVKVYGNRQFYTVHLLNDQAQHKQAQPAKPKVVARAGVWGLRLPAQGRLCGDQGRCVAG